MSRIGKKPVSVPAGVDVKVEERTITVKGPKGELRMTVHPLVSLSLADADGGKEVQVNVPNPDNVDDRAQWGTARANIANMMEGVTKGYTKALEVNGVGYRVALSGKKVVLHVGLSHPVEYQIPEGVNAGVEGNVLTLTSTDRQKLGQVAAEIRTIKKPEPYKGKGIKYTDETIRRKAGKAAKAGE
jgi:large subunit ribosomal protein L6